MIIAKFLTSLRDDTVIAQEEIESQLNITENLDWFGFANFTMPVIDWIEEDVVVELYRVENTDKLLYRGYIHQIKPIWLQFWQMEVTLRSEKAVFYRRLILSDTSYSNQDIKTVIEWLVNVYNTTYWENWVVSTDFNENVSIDVTTGDDIYDILDELAEQTDAKWIVNNWNIEFKRNLGVDRSTWSLYQEVIYDWAFPNNANIASIDVVWTATRANIVIWSDGSSTTVDDSWYTTRLYWATYERFRDWDVANKTAKRLEKRDRLQRIYNVEVEQNTITANIGDKIKLIVENTNSFFDIDDSVIVKKKNTSISNWLISINYELEEFTTTPVTGEVFLQGIKKAIRLLQI